MPLVSIIVPVYNVGKFLEQCIESILNQKFSDFELILIDDGSTDGSGNLCDCFAKKDARVKVLHKENGGVVSARKEGISIACGKYISFVDGDDWIDPDMHLKMVSRMEEFNCDMVMCAVDHENNNRPLTSGATRICIEGGYFDRARIEKEVLPYMIYSGHFFTFGIYPVMWNKLYRREKIAKHILALDDSINIGEDAACVYPYIFETDSMYYISDTVLYHYRRSHAQMTSTYDSRLFSSFEALHDFLEQSELAKSEYASQLNYYYAYFIKTTVSNELAKGNDIPFSKKLRNIKTMTDFALRSGFLDKLDIGKMPFIHRSYFKLMKKNKPRLMYMGIALTRLLQKVCR